MSIDSDLAVDGIEELFDTFADAPPDADLSGAPVLRLVARSTDGSPEVTWTVAIDPELGARSTDRDPSMVTSGSADQLLLRLWNRPASTTDETPQVDHRQVDHRQVDHQHAGHRDDQSNEQNNSDPWAAWTALPIFS